MATPLAMGAAATAVGNSTVVVGGVGHPGKVMERGAPSGRPSLLTGDGGAAVVAGRPSLITLVVATAFAPTCTLPNPSSSNSIHITRRNRNRSGTTTPLATLHRGVRSKDLSNRCKGRGKQLNRTAASTTTSTQGGPAAVVVVAV